MIFSCIFQFYFKEYVCVCVYIYIYIYISIYIHLYTDTFFLPLA